MSRDPQVRSARGFCSGPASMAPLVGSVAEELKDSNVVAWFACRCGPPHVDLQRGRRTVSVCFNVEIWPYPAYGSWVRVFTAWSAGLNLIGGRARI